MSSPRRATLRKYETGYYLEKGCAARAKLLEDTQPRHQPMGSVAEPRFCGMGSKCTQARFLGEPARLRATSSSKLCGRCEEEGLSPDDILEEHDELFHAARVLFEEGVADDDSIIPTLVAPVPAHRDS
jgi:hypothetical protein